eukprot:TRINITY_DN780_c0_g2_i1.p1 TRINITY_DN780_c0_g2~~TRINITY_DN780_c0_g2_i1.p1  ORF type:complete len:352 (+),score=45.47 TRINITY_DN780_c0_g2_i1:129-1184(+)
MEDPLSPKSAQKAVGDALRAHLFKEPLFSESFEDRKKQTTKVTVVGVGNVGMACAQTILTQGLCDELALVDVDENRLQGELMDLQHAAAFLPRTKIVAGTDYILTKGSDLCIVTAGARQREGESRISLVGRNAGLFKGIIPPLVQHSPNTILLIVSNPVDVLTYIAWKISGLPVNRVIGSGTNLDSSRFRFLIADALDVNAQNVHGYIIGEHGDTSVPVWSGVSVAGVPLVQHLQTTGFNVGVDVLRAIHKQVVDGAYEVIKLKGFTNWAIGYSVASISRSILRDQRRIHQVSVLVKGVYDIEDEVYVSLPCMLGRSGLISIIQPPLQPEELQQLQASVKGLAAVAKDITI